MPYAKQPVYHRTMAITRIPFEGRTNLGPHAGRNGLLLFANRIGIDGGNFHDGVAHPLREHIGNYPQDQGTRPSTPQAHGSDITHSRLPHPKAVPAELTLEGIHRGQTEQPFLVLCHVEKFC